MNKSFLIFIILSLIIIGASLAYRHYCKLQNPECTVKKADPDDFGPIEGIDW